MELLTLKAMDASYMDTIPALAIGRLALALAAGWIVYLGYRLFCEAPLRFKSGGIAANMVSGALLALVGAGVLVADIRSAVRPGPGEARSTRRRVLSHPHSMPNAGTSSLAADRAV